MSLKDKRALDVGSDRSGRDYATGLERRVSNLEAPLSSLVAPDFKALPEASNVITVRVQLHELDGSIPDGQRVVEVYTSTDARGAVVALNTSLTVTTGTQLRAETAAGWLVVLTDAQGRLTLNLSHSAAATYYLNVVWKDRVFASTPLVWT